jgi:hypothetical protein
MAAAQFGSIREVRFWRRRKRDWHADLDVE